MDINKELFPSAKFFKTNNEFVNILNLLQPLSQKQLIKRKKALLEIKEDNLNEIFNYSDLTERLINFIHN